ncbi:MAG: hydroxyacylglutathione hydrolase [Hyphomicrobiales bacterium]|jgi:hydroxyacylglutathione hydrolase|nr:hydroxyacylglutathione hydrolase [Hyphomicrobiales bacterium]|tara:strand:+ start:827 stop:1597 length:771 start_codon:yes stop_codon:yes gene_type:complete
MNNYDIFQFICREDNYGVLIADNNTGLTASIDAPDASAIDNELKKRDLKLTHLFITHKHADHTDGIDFLKKKYGCTVIGPDKEKNDIPCLDVTVIDEEYIDFSGSPVRVIETPGHTLGHIVYFFERENILFAGDTIFLMGCGRVFEGTHDQMFESMKKIKSLPNDTSIYCGHEYSLQNAKFAISIEPDNKLIEARMKDIERKTLQNIDCLPTNLEIELKTNPFLRYDEMSVRKILEMEKVSDKIIFSEIRKRKDNF